MDEIIAWICGAVAVLVFIIILPVIFVSGFTLNSTQGEHIPDMSPRRNRMESFGKLGTSTKTNTTSTQEDEYCVADPSLVTALQADQQSSKQITIDFADGMWMMPSWKCSGDDSAIITSVK